MALLPFFFNCFVEQTHWWLSVSLSSFSFLIIGKMTGQKMVLIDANIVIEILEIYRSSNQIWKTKYQL